MTPLWLVVWLLCDTPAVTFTPTLNTWAIALIVCLACDVLRVTA